jgi:hypothetical protein
MFAQFFLNKTSDQTYVKKSQMNYNLKERVFRIIDIDIFSIILIKL